MKKYLILIFVLFFVSFVYADTYDIRGKHGVEIEGQFYDCGENDGVCPEDFFDSASGLDCSANPDCDCSAYASDPLCAAPCTDCNDFTDDLTCNTKTCGTTSCYLGENILGADRCYDCDSTITCADYNDDESDTCDIDHCELNCVWDDVDGECIESLSVCGNGVIEPGESCDGTVLPQGIQKCDDLGYDNDVDLTCGTGCLFDLSSCSGDCGGTITCYDFDLIGGALQFETDCSVDTNDCFDPNDCAGTSCSDFTTETPCESDLAFYCTGGYVCFWDNNGCLEYSYTCLDGYEECDGVCVPIGECSGQCDYSHCNSVCAGGAQVCNPIPEGCGNSIDCSTVQQPSLETPMPFPIFTWINLIIAGLIVTGFYVFIHKRKV